MPRPSNADAIRRAAIACFAEKGYDGTRIADIARRAGVSVAALYNHYPSVQALAQDVYLTHFRAYSEELASIVGDTEDACEGARRIVAATMARYREDPAAFTFVSQRLPSFLGGLPGDIALPLDIVARLVVRGQEANVFAPGDPALLATMFLGALLRVVFMVEFQDLHGFRLDAAHDALIESRCVALLRREPGT